MNKCMVHVLSNLSTIMCHAFIKNQAMMPPNNAHIFSTNLEDDLLKKKGSAMITRMQQLIPIYKR